MSKTQHFSAFNDVYLRHLSSSPEEVRAYQPSSLMEWKERGVEQLITDYGNLLETGQNSDFVIIVAGDNEIAVHKCILSGKCCSLSFTFENVTI